MGIVQKTENDESIESRSNKFDKKQYDATKSELKLDCSTVQSFPSITSLIIWNISKALEIVPGIDIKGGIKAAQERLQHDSGNVISQNAEEQHFMCALLAWQKLGHANADSLHEFIKSKKVKDHNETAVNKIKEIKHPRSYIVAPNSINVNYNYDSEQIDSVNLEAYSRGPVIKLPTETKIIMRVDNTHDNICRNHARPKETTKKLDDACCMDKSCSEHLAKMDADTEKLRTRAKLLAKREAHRAELLERAEAAWKDLERGYQRRLTLAQEKEEDIAKQIKKIAEERNEYKKACTALTDELQDKGKDAEKIRAKLKEVEAELCNCACKRLKLSEVVAETESALADQQCKAVQLERDLELKEDQARRKIITYESEAASARALTNEAERALRAELGGLREQITEVSNQLLKEEEENKKLKTELEKLRQEKVSVIADLDGCQLLCDGKIKAQMDELQNKREQLDKLKQTVLDCQCKFPVDASVMVKRTPSLAALCKCSADDRLLGGSCSCTSVRSTVISNLLADLFGGLQSELGGAGSEMPCRFLKCLEDQHNWDRASETKSSLRNYFSNLLVEELNVAIATSIENYHARWVGPTCADLYKMAPGPDDDADNKGWEKRAIERKAQQLATKLAEDLYQQRAAELTKRAKEIVTSGPPPCKCDRSAKLQTETLYPCFMESMTLIRNRTPTPEPPKTRRRVSPSGINSPDSWRRTNRDVTQLKLEIEGLKKDAIKKKDLEIMEQKIVNIVKRVTVPEHEDSTTKYNANVPLKTKKEAKYIRTTDDMLKNSVSTKTGIIKKKPLDAIFKNKRSQIYEKPTKQGKKYNYHQTYAVNMCLYEQKLNKSVHNAQLKLRNSPISQKSPQEVLSEISSFAQLKSTPSPEVDKTGSKEFGERYCASNCKCLDKEPSGSSIDKLLEKLTKWKSNLGECQDKYVNNMTKSPPNKGSKRILRTENSKTNYSKEKEERCSENQISNRIYQNERKYQSDNSKEAVNTESEYIVAINLDKSVMNVHPDALNDTEFDFKHHPRSTGIENIQSCLDEAKLVNDNSYTKHTIKLNVLTNSKSIGAMPEKRKVKEAFNEINFHSDSKNKKDMLSKNLDYYIQFLGVTLADVNPKKVNKRLGKDDHDKGNNYSPPSSYTSKEHNKQNQNDMPGIPNLISTKDNYNVRDNNNVIYTFNDQIDIKNVHTNDIGIDSASLKHSKNALENCVCCNTKVGDYSKDLEVNTFNLLEVHLREKFKECHICSCNSACISSEDKEKIFCTILNRVKQVISDCVKEMKCNETGSLSTGSWERAYGLMQEYLKIKVKRAQHLSLSKKEKDAILPEILDKVCNLIENDFQRIKNICQCKKKDETSPTVPPLLKRLSFPNKELPVKDNDISFKQNATDAIEMVSRQNSPKSSVLRMNISSQIDYDLKKETKSFGVMVANDNVNNNDITRKVSREYYVKSLGLAESKPIAFIPSIPFQVAPDVVNETKACDPMTDATNIVKIISRANLVNRIGVTKHTSQVSFNLGMENKGCDANYINKMVSRANSTQLVVPARHMSSQIPSKFEIETKSCDTMVDSKNIKLSKANSINLEVITNNTSCQVLPIFGVKSESDDIKTTSSNNEQNSQLNTFLTSEKNSRVIIYNDSAYFYKEEEANSEALRSYNSHKSLVNLLREDGVIIESRGIHLCQNLGSRYVKSLPNLGFEGTVKDKSTELSNNLPYIGCTVDCMCDSKLKTCTCAKSLIQKYVDKFSDYWQSIFHNQNKTMHNCSYIMSAKRNKNDEQNVDQKFDNLPLNNVPMFVKQHSDDKNACEAEINVRNEEDIVLLLPKQKVETGQRSTNTYVKKANNLVTDTESEIPLSWCQHPPQSLSSNPGVSADSVYESTNEECTSSCVTSKDGSAATFSYCFYKRNEESKLSSKSRSNYSDGTGTSGNCTCDKVPLCHVKMLVENIEKNLKQ